MALPYASVQDRLRTAVPEFADQIDEHIATYGELLSYLLFGDLARFLMAAGRRGDEELARRCLDFLERELSDGDAQVQNLVKVGFVESVDLEDVGARSFIETWPPALRAEAEDQRIWTWGRPRPVKDNWIAVSESDDLETARIGYLEWLASHHLSESDLDSWDDLRIDLLFMRDEGRAWRRYRFRVRASVIPRP